MHLYGESIETSFSQNVLNTDGCNLQCMIKVNDDPSIRMGIILKHFFLKMY